MVDREPSAESIQSQSADSMSDCSLQCDSPVVSSCCGDTYEPLRADSAGAADFAGLDCLHVVAGNAADGRSHFAMLVLVVVAALVHVQCTVSA